MEESLSTTQNMYKSKNTGFTINYILAAQLVSHLMFFLKNQLTFWKEL